MAGKPDTRRDMLRARYELLGKGTCKSCGAAIEWWKTTHGKKIPFNLADDDNADAITHFATCPNAAGHRGQGQQPTPPAAPVQAQLLAPPPQQAHVDRLVDGLCRQTNAQCIALVLDGSTIVRWRNGLSGEDGRQSLIAAGNQIRTDIAKQEFAQ